MAADAAKSQPQVANSLIPASHSFRIRAVLAARPAGQPGVAVPTVSPNLRCGDVVTGSSAQPGKCKQEHRRAKHRD